MTTQSSKQPNPGQPAYQAGAAMVNPSQVKKPAFDPEVDGRSLDDVDAIRGAIFQNVQDAVAKRFPLENQRYMMRVNNLRYDRDKPFTLAEQKRAIMSRKSLHNKLKGDWELVDKASGAVVDTQPATIAKVPYMTQRGTFINNGKEYSVANQMRLMDGVYSRQKGDGTFESHFNLMSGTGRAFRVGMDPKTGSFNLAIGQAKLPMYPLFRALGVEEDDLKKSWGDDIYNANKKHDDGSVVSKLYERFSGEKVDPGEASSRLKEYIAKMKMSAAVARRSLQKYGEFDEDEDGKTTLTPAALLATTKKLIAMSRGEDEADDRDALSNQVVMSVEDLFAERIAKDAGGKLREALWKATNKGKLPSNLQNVMSTQLESVLINSGLGSPLEEINPIEALDQMNRVTRMGSGGIGSTDAVPDEARGVQPSYAGFIDPFRTTECYSEDMEVLTDKEWVKWPDVHIGMKLAIWKDGKIEYEKPDRLYSYDYEGVMYGVKSPDVNYLVTPDHRIYVVADNGNCFFDVARDVHGYKFNVITHKGEVTTVYPREHSKERYSGKVYCATVSTGLLIVRRGETPGFVCGNSEKVGVDVRFAAGLRKGRDGKIYRQVLDARTGDKKWISPEDSASAVIAFPGELEKNEAVVRGVSGGEIGYFPRDEVGYQIASGSDLHDVGVNLIPMANATQGNRLMVAGKMLNQAMSLANREAPRVRTKYGDNDTFEGAVGSKMGAIRAEVGGTVERVTADSIRFRGDDGKLYEKELYNNFPLNRKSYYYSVPNVAPGDRVEAGGVLASSNYTDKDGNVALGTHLRTAFLPYKGLGYEDAYVISESAAKKLSHEAMYTQDFDKEDGERGYNKFVSFFPQKYKEDQLKNMDKEGVIKPGTVVRKGDPLVLAVGDPKQRGEGQLSGLHRSIGGGKTDKTITWEHDYDGEVTDAYVDDDGSVKVAIKAQVGFKEGDKMAGLFGDKGVVSKIVPDELMPHDANGQPYELLQNPLTLPTRKNPAQLYTMILSKLARIRGKEYVLDKYHDGSLGDFVRAELKKAGLNEDGTEEVYDPETGRMNKILTGDKYIMALHHTAEAKSGARDAGGQGSKATYTAEGLPARGGKEGSKSMANLGMNALISHNAYATLGDMKAYRANRNDDFWRSFMLGYPPPSPKVPDIYKKFVSHLRGAGVNFKKKGDYTHLTAMTDKDVDELAGDRTIKSPLSLDEDLQPIAGGLFDTGSLGGVGGQHWGKIELPEPMPSPVMEDSIKTLLGLTGTQFDNIVAGNEKLGGKIGGTAIRDALAAINIDDAIEVAKKDIAGGKKTARDNAVKRLRLLSKAKEFEIHPKDWVISKIPVIPPSMRPISKMESGTALISDANSLYSNLMYNSEAYNEAKKKLGDDGVASERKAIYDSLKAVVGTGDPVHPKLQEKGVAGLLKHVFGKGSPKFGMYQRRVIGMNLDLSGRAVITPNPSLDMDEVGLPADQAWKLYGKFVARNMIRNGLSATQALKEVEDKTDRAKDMLIKEMDSRPLTYTRAPAMTRLGIMGAKPQLVSGDSLQISPIISEGFVADHDGDAHLGTVLFCSDKKIEYIEKYDIIPVSYYDIIGVGNFTGGNMAYYNCGTLGFDNEKYYYVADLSAFPHDEKSWDNGRVQYYSVPDGLKVIGVGSDGKLGWYDVSGWSQHAQCELVIVRFKSGRSYFTDEDPRAVLGISSASMAWERTTPKSAVDRGMMVACVNQIPHFSEVEYWDLPAVSASRAHNGHKIVSRLKLTYDVGYLFGVLCGDGYSSQKNGQWQAVSICCGDRDVGEATTKLFKLFFYDEVNVGEKKAPGSFVWTVYSSVLSEAVAKIIGHGARNKKLPNFYLNSSRQVRLGLLAGLMDTDGFVGTSSAKHRDGKVAVVFSYSTVSSRLAREIAILARSVGIKATVSTTNNHGFSSGTLYVVYFQAQSCIDLFSAMKCERKKAKVRNYMDSLKPVTSGKGADCVPFPSTVSSLCAGWIADNGIRAKDINLYTALMRSKNNGRILRDTAKLSIDQGFSFPDNQEYIRWQSCVYDTSITWEEVVDVEYTGDKYTMYDLTVPGAENFMSVDGVILSNTMSFHVPVGDDAIKEINEKLLPSKHLKSVSNFDVHYLPGKEYLLGLYQATAGRKKGEKSTGAKYFADVASLKKAYRRGEVKLSDDVIIGSKS